MAKNKEGCRAKLTVERKSLAVRVKTMQRIGPDMTDFCFRTTVINR